MHFSSSIPPVEYQGMSEIVHTVVNAMEEVSYLTRESKTEYTEYMLQNFCEYYENKKPFDKNVLGMQIANIKGVLPFATLTKYANFCGYKLEADPETVWYVILTPL